MKRMKRGKIVGLVKGVLLFVLGAVVEGIDAIDCGAMDETEDLR